MRQRSNSEWLSALRAGGQNQAVALAELRELVLGAIIKFLSRNETPGGSSFGHDLHQTAEDCAQEAIILIQSKLEQFRGESKFTTWAYSIAVRVTLWGASTTALAEGGSESCASWRRYAGLAD